MATAKNVVEEEKMISPEVAMGWLDQWVQI